MMYDTLIIGSGPAGLTAAIYASRAGLQYAVIEREPMGTGQIAYTERVDNYPGFYGIDGFSLGEKLREHAETLGTAFLEHEVTGLKSVQNGWQILTAAGDVLESRTVICASGASPKRLEISGESEWTGRGVSYCALCDGAFFTGKRVAVIGGGNTALSDALYLAKLAEKVYLIHRRDVFRADHALIEQAAHTDNIELVLQAIPVEIQGTDSVTALIVSRNGNKHLIPADGVFVAVGSVPNTAYVREIAELDSIGYIIAPESGETSAKGLFAAGDIRTKQVRQVVTATADGANAIASVQAYIQKAAAV